MLVHTEGQDSYPNFYGNVRAFATKTVEIHGNTVHTD